MRLTQYLLQRRITTVLPIRNATTLSKSLVIPSIELGKR